MHKSEVQIGTRVSEVKKDIRGWIYYIMFRASHWRCDFIDFTSQLYIFRDVFCAMLSSFPNNYSINPHLAEIWQFSGNFTFT